MTKKTITRNDHQTRHTTRQEANEAKTHEQDKKHKTKRYIGEPSQVIGKQSQKRSRSVEATAASGLAHNVHGEDED